jgi:hypothetical protein
MPTEYSRKSNCQRGAWTEEQLVLAAEAVRTKNMGVREASRNFNVPAPTLRRRIKKII